ncbi:conserved domain protein, partial [Enterococcus faecalis TX1467]
MRSLIDSNNYEVGVDKLMKTAMVLEQEMGMVYEYTWIIGVPLIKKDLAVDLKETVTNSISNVSEKFVKGLGFDVELSECWEKDYREQELEVYQNLSELLIERLSEDELYYYQAYQFLKNIPHERQDVLSSQNLDNLMATKIKPLFGGGLHLNCDYGESYISYLPMGDVGVFLDGNHFLEVVQKMPFPVEVKIQATFAESKGQLALSGRSSRARTRTKNIMQEAHLAGSKQKRKIVEGQLSLDDLDQKIDDGVDIIDWKAVVVVSGSTKKQMRARKKYLINRFDSLD